MSSTDNLQRDGSLFVLHQWLTVAATCFIVIGGVFTVYDSKANAEDVEIAIAEVKKQHAQDFSQLQRDIRMQRLEDYNDKLHILDNKRNKTHEDRSAIKYYNDRKDALVIEINNGG